jgi:hypothetical protein
VREGGIGIEHALCGSVRISRRDTIPLTRILVLSKLRARPASSLSKCLMSESRQHLEGDGQFGFDQAIISVRHSACVLVVLVESAAPQMCLSSAKLRSTDSVNPRAVLSRENAPAIGIYSRHRDRRYWPGTGIGIEDRIIVAETA